VTIAVSSHDKRLLIAGSASIVIIVGGSRLVRRAMEWSASERTSAASLAAEVSKEEASIRGLLVTRDSLVARRVRLASMDSTLVEADTPALAGAALAELVSDAADATRAQVGNVQVRADSSTRRAFVGVQVRASITGDFAAIVRFLSKLESGPKLVALRELDITAQGNQSTTQGGRDVIRADVLVEGLARNHSSRQDQVP
jgi:hypothetical protein